MCVCVCVYMCVYVCVCVCVCVRVCIINPSLLYHNFLAFFHDLLFKLGCL